MRLHVRNRGESISAQELTNREGSWSKEQLGVGAQSYKYENKYTVVQ